MARRLDDFPDEIVESIVVLLDLKDICSLRQTNRILAAKANQRQFQSFFRAKKVDMIESTLEAFVTVTQPGWLGCLVEDLTLVGIVNNPKGLEEVLRKKTKTVTEHRGLISASTKIPCSAVELTKTELDLKILRQRREDYQKLQLSGRDVALLTEAFSNIAAFGKVRRLRSLSLEVVVYREDAQHSVSPTRGGGWKYIWQITASTFQAAMPALAASKLEVESLHIFSGPQMQRCSIARNEMSAVDFEEPGLAASLAFVKSLSISLSDRSIDEDDQQSSWTGDPSEIMDWHILPQQRDIEFLRAEATDDSNFIGIAKLIALCRNLEELDLHYYRLRFYLLENPDLHIESVLRRLIETAMTSLSKLRKFRLRGLHVREEDLGALLKHAPIKELALEYIVMKEGGTFASIFDYCTSATAVVQKLFFDDLFEDDLLHFDGPGEPKFPGGSTWPNTLTREGTDVQRNIKYRVNSALPVGSFKRHKWDQQRWAEYGPP